MTNRVRHGTGGWLRGGVAAGLLLSGSLAAAQTPAAAPARDPQKSNPFADRPEAVAEGRALYMKWGCYGCHGTQGGGGMGPSLTDAEWRYGAGDAEVFQSVHTGRPNGMPGWGDKLSEEEIWKVIAYLRSLDKSAAAPSGR